MTIQMQENPGVVETIIDMLNHINVDGETMEYIINKVHLKDQMVRQLNQKYGAGFQNGGTYESDGLSGFRG